MREKILKNVGIFVIVLGICVCIFPTLANKYNDIKMIGQIEDFIDETGNTTISTLDLLRKRFEEYNENLVTNGQQLVDAFSYQDPSFELSEYGYSENILGYLDIPQMDITLPIYWGASKENLSKGAALLSQTSIPIGGESTNAVIAAHRGMSTKAMFRNIEKLKLGDVITVTNAWEELEYQVCEIRVITPDYIDAILIQEGRDLITLITCHPYRHNYQRYVVYAERI